MDRRALLKTGGLAALGVAAGGCAGRRARTGPPPPYVNLPLIEASWGRVIRTTVGLRPYRPSGFDLRAEKLDAKTVIHNYGHGGAGHSLGWGTGALAADMALEHGARRAAVVGCGTVGLTAARQLQRRGFAVTIYAKSVPPYTTSNMALAGFTPTSGLVADDRRTPEWDVQFRRAIQISYEQLQLLVGRGYGVSWVYNYRPMNELPEPGPRAAASQSPPPLRPPETRTGGVVLQPGEHPFPSRYASRTSSLRIEPAIYLDRLVHDFVYFGGRIVMREFATRRDLMSLNESLIVNCTGLGARDLFADDELMPVKGQLIMLVPQPEVNYATSGGVPGRNRGGFVHMMPRRDGIALGGTAERGVSSLEPNEEARQRIVDTHIELFNGMQPPDREARLTAAAPGEIPKVESFFGLES